MIKLLKGSHEHIHVDATMLETPVPPYNPPTSTNTVEHLNAVVMYLSGIARANNAEFVVEGQTIYLRASDIPQAQVVDLGIMDEDDLANVEALKWDLLPFGGKWLVEIPVAHKTYLQKISEIKRLPYTLQFNIVFFEDGTSESSGVSLESFIDLNIDYFDVVRSGDYDKILDATSTGFNLSWRPSLLETSFHETITTTLAGMIGDDALVNLSDQIPYKTEQLGREGFRVSSQVDFIDAGFKCLVKTAYIPNGLVFDFDVENSTADFSRAINGLPVVRRRQVKSRRVLELNKPVEVARIESEVIDQGFNGLPFIRRIRGKRQVIRNGTISVLVKRTE